MTPVVDAETVKQGSKAVKTFTQPHVFPGVVALVAMAAVGVLIYWTRQDAIRQQEAFLGALDRNTAAVERVADKVSTQGALVEAVRHEVERLRDRAR